MKTVAQFVCVCIGGAISMLKVKLMSHVVTLGFEAFNSIIS